jgi:hypothetical protein
VIARAASVAAAVLALAACGGGGDDDHAGLTRAQADERIAAALAEAENEGAVERALQEAIAGTPQEAMGRAGGSGLGGAGPKVLRAGRSVARAAAPGSGEEAWVGSYAVAGIGSALTLCVYVWDGGSAVEARTRC